MLVESCPYGALRYDAEKHRLTLMLYACMNQNCLECLKADKDVGCLQIKPEFFSTFQELMAIGAKKVLDTFNNDKQFFLNFALQVTPHCDCMGISLFPQQLRQGALSCEQRCVKGR